MHKKIETYLEKERESKREGEQQKEIMKERKAFSIDTIAFPSPFIAVLVLELFICVSLHGYCENETKSYERGSAHLGHILIIQGYRFGKASCKVKTHQMIEEND